MPKREVDQRKTRKALRKLRKAAESAGEEGAPGLTDWEKDFVEAALARVAEGGALSNRQQQVTRAITAKTRKAKAAAKTGAAPRVEPAKPTPGSSFQRKSTLKPKAKSGWKPRIRDINDDPERSGPPTESVRPKLKLVPGGRRG